MLKLLWTEVTDMFIAIFEGMEDNPYMQERAADIRGRYKNAKLTCLVRNYLTPATTKNHPLLP